MLIVLTLKGEDRFGNPGKIVYFDYPVKSLTEFASALNACDFLSGKQMEYNKNFDTGKKVWSYKKDLVIQSTEVRNCSNYLGDDYYAP